MTYDAAQYRIIVTCKHNTMDTISLQSTHNKCIFRWEHQHGCIFINGRKRTARLPVSDGSKAPMAYHECPSYVFSSAQQHHILSCCTDGEHDYYREHRERERERHTRAAARSRCRRAARVPATARACARWPVLPQLAASNRCRTAAALTPHAPQRPHPHSILVGSWCTLLYSSPKSPCGLPTVSLRCCLGLAADELIHEEIHTFDSLLSFFFTNFSIDQSETLQTLEKGTKFLLWILHPVIL